VKKSWQNEDVEIKENNLIHKGAYQLNQLSLRHRCFSGEWSPWILREQVTRADAAAILLFDPKEAHFVLVEQFRVGALGRDKQSPWLLEVVAGLLEPGESAEVAIEREAEEEAGCVIEQIVKIGDFYTTPGGFCEKTSLFAGSVNTKGMESSIRGVADEHEDIRVHILPISVVIKAMQAGELLTSASTLIALQWFELNKKNLL